MDPTIRLIEDSEFDAVYDCAVRTFGLPVTAEDRDDSRAWVELDRTFAAFDEGAVVATGGAVSLPIVVPGGDVVPAAAVTFVTTAPTHRRQGLMAATMAAVLEQAVTRREPLATLWASESSIYGRFGFGAAIGATDLRIDRHHAALRPDIPRGAGRVRLYDSERAAAVIPGVYERATRDVPGAMVRRPQDWRQMFEDAGAARDGKTGMRYAVYEEDGVGLGYARYRNTEVWEDMNAAGVVEVFEYHAPGATAYAELWRFLSALDLMVTIKVRGARLNPRLALLLANPRRLRATIGETIWVRLLDTPVALRSRRYAESGEIVIEIEDPLGYGSGRFALSGGPSSAEVQEVDGPAEVVMSAEALGAVYLGGTRVSELAWAGRVAGRPEAIARFDAMMRWPVEPHCTVHF